jgi:hypothetical protein
MTTSSPTAYPYRDRWQIVTPEHPVAVTEIDPVGDPDLADHAPGARCSQCGKGSVRLARSELWAIRHKPRDDNKGIIRLYCREHLPSREWVQGGTTSLTVRDDEFTCLDCWFVVRVGTPCATSGAEHHRQ